MLCPENPDKNVNCEVMRFMTDRQWHEKAAQLYFSEHKSIIEVAAAVGRTRQTVSTFLNSQKELWKREQEYRRSESRKRRKAQKHWWEFHNRIGINLAREHEQAVRELSAERYR